MLVGLDGKGFESALVEVTGSAGAVMRMPTHAVRDGKPLKELANFLVGLWPDHEVPMIGHHRKIENPQPNTLLGLFDDSFKRFVVTLFLEQRQASH